MIHPSNKFLDFETVLQQIDVPPPGEMVARISALPKAGTLPGPATTWLFINLMLYRIRQRWARKQLQQHIPDFFVGDGDPAPLSEGERIPGMPEWQLDAVFDGWGAIAHRGTREYISGLSRQRGRHAQDLVFPHELREMVHAKSPWDIPGRLAAATGDGELEAAIEELVLVRILLETDFYGLAWEEMVGDPDAHRLSETACRLSRGVSRFRRLWDDPDNRLWLAAAIGDWPSANELAQSHDNPEIRLAVAEKFEAYRQRRLAIARFNLSLEPDSADDLKVLYREGADDFSACINRAVETAEVDPALAGLLAETGDPQWNERLFAAFTRVSLNPTDYLSFELFELAEPLLERGCHADDVLTTLATQDRDLDRVALIFLKHAPAQALPIIRRALRHERVEPVSEEDAADFGPQTCPSDRRRTAAILLIIDRPWAAQELIAATTDLWEERHAPTEIVSLILALVESADPTTRAAGEDWLARIGAYEHLESETSEFRKEWHVLYEEAIALQGVSVGTVHK